MELVEIGRGRRRRGNEEDQDSDLTRRGRHRINQPIATYPIHEQDAERGRRWALGRERGGVLSAAKLHVTCAMPVTSGKTTSARNHFCGISFSE